MFHTMSKIDFSDIDEKFWKTIENEKKIFEINSLQKTIGETNGNQGKPKHRPRG